MPEHNSTGNQKPTLSWSQPAAAKPINGNIKSAEPVAAPVKAVPASASAKSNSSSGTGMYVGIFVAGLILGAALGWGITSNKSGSPVTTGSTDSTATITDTSTSGSNTATTQTGADLSAGTGSTVVLAPNQQAGFAVVVSKVWVKQPTWLVVYEDTNGTPGNAIGAGLFFAGTTDGTIQLLRATLPGQSYFVGQSLDDGDKVFSLASDKPVRDVQGNPLFTQFTAN